MSLTRTVPKNASELFDYLKKIHENRKHVNSIKVNNTTGHIEIDLDWTANKVGGYPDVYIPLKRGKQTDAKELIERMLRQSESGYEPTLSDATRLFDMIDPQG